ncbi:hypothetical protein [Priestia megaterium]|uniref:hypothetical protein n=1 Tax=Priestia megaterium TaxID=1404 RepID=UPI000BF263EA|nr:hypothetical protein [Priestia megaterium]PFI59468.1 hypothetical protein COI68_27175 [Priestia megaterium]PFT50398.1 hypothetical protein COK68_26845 [Priestia megaterium]
MEVYKNVANNYPKKDNLNLVTYLYLLDRHQREVLTQYYPRWVKREITDSYFSKILCLEVQVFYRIIKEYDALI